MARYYYFSPLALVLRNGEWPEFNIQEYMYALAAPSLEQAQGFLLARNKEWMEHWRKIEEETLDPNRELPPTSGGSSHIYFKGCSSSWSLNEEEDLRLLLKDEHATYVAYAFIRGDGFSIQDAQWKKIGDPGTLLFAMPDGTPILVNGKYKVKILPKEIRTVSEALAYLDGKEQP
jgi:hypothetical protein